MQTAVIIMQPQKNGVRQIIALTVQPSCVVSGYKSFIFTFWRTTLVTLSAYYGTSAELKVHTNEYVALKQDPFKPTS
jgi:hypothetical protein